MVLDPHAQSIDQNSNHNSSSEVLAVHNLPKCITNQPPEANNVCCRFAKPQVLLCGLPTVSPISVLKIVAEFIYAFTVRVSRGVVALRATL